MKLREFLKQFEGEDLDSEMIFTMSVGCCGESEPLDIPDVYTNRDTGSFDPYVCLNFPSLDFLNSCRKYGTARDLK